VEKPQVLSHTACNLHTMIHRSRPALIWLTAGVLMLTLILMPHPGSAQDNLPPKFVTGLLDLPLSDYHLKPQGLIVENSGVIAQPRLNLFFQSVRE